MTREEAIYKIEYIRDGNDFKPTDAQVKALDMAIEALSMPCMTEADFDSYKLGYEHGKAVAIHDVSGDLISRQELLEKYKCRGSHGTVTLHEIVTFPSVDAEPVRHEKWIKHVDNSPSIGMYVNWNCSNCNYNGQKSYNFCPNCGAKMGGDTA